VVVNQVRPRDIAPADLRAALDGTLDTHRIARDLERAGVHDGPDLVTGLVTEARDHAERRALEDAQRAVVASLGRPTFELPRLPGGVDLGGLYELAGHLAEGGLR
jgi:hypothetical protein